MVFSSTEGSPSFKAETILKRTNSLLYSLEAGIERIARDRPDLCLAVGNSLGIRDLQEANVKIKPRRIRKVTSMRKVKALISA